MSQTSIPKPFEDIIIELMEFSFKWIPGEDSYNQKNEAVKTTAVIDPSTDDTVAISGFCDIALTRSGYKFNNFSISSRYYYSGLFTPSKYRSRRTWESNLVKNIIWTRFVELARMAAVSAGSNPYDIPLSPEKVQYPK